MNRPRLIMMIGLPGSGKSYRAKILAEEYDANVHSSDSIREELSGDIDNQDINDLVFRTLHNRIKEDLQNGKNCIYDATNISYKKRMAFLQELQSIPCEKICILMATPYKECLKNNSNRDRVVPEEVIERMYKNFNIPFFYEGWNQITVEYGKEEYHGYYGYPTSLMELTMSFDQNNKHHTLSLGEHLRNTAHNLPCYHNEGFDIYEYALIIAAILHDGGKIFTKDFRNGKGEPTEDAHYFNHHNVGAYDSLFYNDKAIGTNDSWVWLYISVLIMWHMQPYFWEKDNNERQHNKYRKLWGEKLHSDIMKLHEADKKAH